MSHICATQFVTNLIWFIRKYGAARPLLRLEGFAIAGNDGNFVWADAVIDGDTVVVSSPEIKKSAAVRYAWELFPLCNLYNGAGLPTSPFRTDDWKLPSEGVEF